LSLLELLKADSAVTDRIAPADLEKLFDLDHHLREVDRIFERVFGSSG
jgi:adenylosuccinate lyase